MGFKIKDLLKLDMLKGSEVISGNGNLNNEIIWINMLEILDELNSLQIGELLITTGYNLNNEELHRDLILNLHKKKLAGLAIQPGYYIDRIPNYIKEQGEKYNFPIIQIPKKITFSHLTRIIIKNINSNKENNDFEKDSLLADIIDNKDITVTKINNLVQKGFNENSCLAVMILSIQDLEDGFILESDIEFILDCFESQLSKIATNNLIEKYHGKYLILINTDDLARIQYELQDVVSVIFENNSNFSIVLGISRDFNTFSSIPKSYKEALLSHDILKKMCAKKGVCSYEHISLFQVIGQTNAKENVFHLLNETIMPISSYDKTHNCNYVETLKIFFLNNYNLSATSQKLYIHRHTLRYRLQKIEENFNINLKDPLTLFKYSLAFQLNNFYN